jgi:hypothetical protein
MDDMRGRFHADYTQTDHRALTESGTDGDGWEEWARAWWDLTPDIAVQRFKVLAEEGEHVAYLVLFAGRDAATGGDWSGGFYVVNQMRDGLVLTTELFDDRAAALARFGELAEQRRA